MSLALMYITNDPQIAQIAQKNGVDWVFVDLEILGKQDRQGHLDTVISGHTIEDVRAVRAVVDQSKLVVRCNPVHEDLGSEIDAIVDAGADVIMLPYFKTADEVRTFISSIDGRAETCLLLETAEAVQNLDEILAVGGIDRVHIGLNDLHLSLGLNFMFELLSNGVVESICETLRSHGIPYGFGGIARLGEGALSADLILAEHHRLGSTAVILSRAFCDASNADLDEIEKVFETEVPKLREVWDELGSRTDDFFEQNRESVAIAIDTIVAKRVNA